MLPKLLTQVFERARTRLGLEVFILDSALTPLHAEGDSDIRHALAGDAALRDALLGSLATGRPAQVRVDGAEFEAVPLRLAANQRGLALVGLSAGQVQRGRATEFWVELVKAVWEANVSTLESLDHERSRSRRLVAMLRFLRHVVETDSEAELAHAIVQAAAVWFDVDARIYQRDLVGDFELYASLPGVVVDEVSQRLSSLWVPTSLELRRVSSHSAWALPSGAELLLLPLTGNETPDWVLALIGSAPDDEAQLPAVGRIAGAHVEFLRARRRDRARARFAELIQPPVTPDQAVTQIVRELAVLTHAGAAVLTLNRRGRLQRLVSIGATAPATAVISPSVADWLFAADQFVCGWSFGDGVTATLEMRPAADQAFTRDAAMLTKVGAEVLEAWLRGAVPSLGEPVIPVQTFDAATAGFLKRIDEELERARRFDLRLSLVLVDLPRQAEPGDVPQRLQEALRHELRGSDVLGRVDGTRVVALLTHTDASGSSRVVERLRKRLAESAARINVAGLTVGHAVFSPECRTAEALVSRAIRDAEPVAV